MIENILWCFHALTNIQLWIPFQFDEKGIASIIYCIDGDDPKIFHPDEFNTAEDEEETYISLLLEIDPSKEKETK